MFELNNFDSIKIGLASPEKIREWSRGEVKKPETINYRTLKPEKDGLFCERIFGPTKDWECHCGKYKRVRYKGIVCDKCGVEVTRAKVRRERMGHIELAAPVSHIWYFRAIPSKMALLLDIPPRSLEKVLYFAAYIVLNPGATNLARKQLLTETEYRKAVDDNRDLPVIDGTNQTFIAKMGGEAIKELLLELDLDQMSQELRNELKDASGQKRVKAVKRLEVVESFRKSGNHPSWMIMDAVPVIPPELRPMVQLDGGRFATSDLNDLYRRVINRNNRLKRLLELGAPDIIVRNEKRMLQEAVDALIDNGRRGRPVTGPGNRALKSLSDLLRGKQGRFRQNLLGKRVDYSGRSVIVVGPDLKMYQCGLPKTMALELFKPFVMKKLISAGYAPNIKAAKRIVERIKPEVWDVLEDVIHDHPVLLNRAPTLHRLSIQAFEPVLVEGKALKLHPLACTAYNADFDGDQMAIHLPLSMEAQAEARFLMLAANNILKPQDGKPVVSPSQDMVIGAYYLTIMGDQDKNHPKAFKGDGRAFMDQDEALMAYQLGEIALQARIKVRIERTMPSTGEKKRKVIETSIGRLIFNDAIPQNLGFVKRETDDDEFKLEIDQVADKKLLGKIIHNCYRVNGVTECSAMADRIKALGFKYSTIGAVTVAVSDVVVPKEKPQLLHEAEEEIKEIQGAFEDGLLSDEERYKRVIGVWDETTNKVTDALKASLDTFNPITMMANSGARGSINQIRQLAGMRGLMADTSGRTIEIPIKANFREGLSVLEYFISSRGARKGLADTALRTADSGYLTRRMVDVCQDVIIREPDCGTHDGVWASAVYDKGQLVQSFGISIHGRFPAVPICDPQTGEVLFDTDHMLMPADADVLEAHGIERVLIRSVLSCEARTGVCAKCYGINLAIGQPVSSGEAVGVIAAQSIGEPGTQLTMRTFHTGGIAGDDITQGLPRVEELFEARKPKKMAVLAEVSGTVSIEETKKGALFAISVTSEEEGETKVYTVPHSAGILVKNGDHVDKGQELTSGALSPHDVLRIRGIDDDEFGRPGVRTYIIQEVQKVYRQQGVDINDKHIEIIVRQMMRKVKIEESGSTDLLSGSTVDIGELKAANRKIEERIEAGEKGLSKATYTQLLMGITKASLATESFLSAASFQETTKVLTEAAIKGKVDHLVGLKENVIIGKLIPAGTGLSMYRDFKEQTDDTVTDDPAQYVDLSALVGKTNAL